MTSIQTASYQGSKQSNRIVLDNNKGAQDTLNAAAANPEEGANEVEKYTTANDKEDEQINEAKSGEVSDENVIDPKISATSETTDEQNEKASPSEQRNSSTLSKSPVDSRSTPLNQQTQQQPPTPPPQQQQHLHQPQHHFNQPPQGFPPQGFPPQGFPPHPQAGFPSQPFPPGFVPQAIPGQQIHPHQFPIQIGIQNLPFAPNVTPSKPNKKPNFNTPTFRVYKPTQAKTPKGKAKEKAIATPKSTKKATQQPKLTEEVSKSEVDPESPAKEVVSIPEGSASSGAFFTPIITTAFDFKTNGRANDRKSIKNSGKDSDVSNVDTELVEADKRNSEEPESNEEGEENSEDAKKTTRSQALNSLISPYTKNAFSAGPIYKKNLTKKQQKELKEKKGKISKATKQALLTQLTGLKKLTAKLTVNSQIEPSLIKEHGKLDRVMEEIITAAVRIRYGGLLDNAEGEEIDNEESDLPADQKQESEQPVANAEEQQA